MKTPLGFLGFWRSSAAVAMCSGAALGCVLVVIALIITEGTADMELELTLDLATALWSLLLAPLFLLLLFSLLLPVSYGLYRLWAAVLSRGRHAEDQG